MSGRNYPHCHGWIRSMQRQILVSFSVFFFFFNHFTPNKMVKPLKRKGLLEVKENGKILEGTRNQSLKRKTKDKYLIIKKKMGRLWTGRQASISTPKSLPILVHLLNNILSIFRFTPSINYELFWYIFQVGPYYLEVQTWLCEISYEIPLHNLWSVEPRWYT